MAFRQTIQKEVFALQGAYHGDAHLGLETASHADKQSVRQAKHVRLRLGLEPRDEFIEFPRLVSGFTAQHGKGQLAQIRRAGFGGLAGGPFEQAGRGKQITQPAWRAPKERGLLGQIDVDAAKEDRRAGALVLFVQRQRQVKWDHEGLVAQLAQRGYQGVIAETAPAIHGAGAGSQL